MKFIKKFDIFANEVKLNINRQDGHRTIIGGAVSLFLKFLWMSYCTYLMQKMVFFKEDRTFSQEEQISHDLEIGLDDSDIKSYVNLVRYIPGDD